MPPLPESERGVALPPFAQKLAPRGNNGVQGLWRALAGGGSGVAQRTVIGQLIITLVPAMFIFAILGVTGSWRAAPEIEGQHRRAGPGGRVGSG